MRAVQSLAIWLIVSAFLASACSSPRPLPPIGEEIPPEEALIAVEAFRGEGRYFLRYQHNNEYFYAAGDLKGRQLLQRAAAGRYESAEVKALVPEPFADWRDIQGRLTPVPILGLAACASFRDRIFSGFMPTRSNSGVAVALERGDYFFFYDREGRFRARRLIDKPPWYEVAERINLAEYYQRWEPVLLDFLDEQGVEGGEVLFNTGDLEAGAIPFIYINTQTRAIVLVRYDELPEGMAGQVPTGCNRCGTLSAVTLTACQCGPSPRHSH